jgi:hypothetical protein
VSPGEQIAQVAHELLDPGPMGWDVRSSDYRAFINANFDDTPAAPVYTSTGTNCAIFVRGVWVQAGIAPRGKRPTMPAITTWLGVGHFSLRDGFGVEDIASGKETIRPGDVLYWAGFRGGDWVRRWKAANNGHVEIVLFDGEGWVHPTAGGGGKHHLCRKSDGPKDVRLHSQRPLRWIWRPTVPLEAA